MGTFAGHIVPGLALSLLGLWHTFNTLKAYNLKGPSGFSSRFWYPFNFTAIFHLKHLELIFIFFFSILVIAMQVLDFPLLHFSFEFHNLEHSTMFAHLAIYAGATLAVELTNSPEIFSGLIGILAASVFSQELFLLHFHSTDHVGVEGHYHWLLQLIVFVSFVSALVMTSSNNSSFVAAIVLSISVVFQGCWFMNMGFMLWFPLFVPRGCTMNIPVNDGDGDRVHGAVTCGTKEASVRAIALANLQFSWILAGILVFTACLCLKMAGKCKERREYSTAYEQLHIRSDHIVGITVEVDHSKQVHP